MASINKLLLVLLFISVLSFAVKSQNIMLGKSPEYITSYYNNDPEYSISIDTINAGKLLINCRSANLYPHHTFEIDRLLDKCISYGFVSKNQDVLNTYIEILEHAGSLVNANESFSEFTYMLDLPNKQIFYTFKRPFLGNALISKRNLYYMVITEERKKLQVGN
jgi:hypothetical protein